MYSFLRQHNIFYVCDFETAASEKNIKEKNTFVYLWDICKSKTYEHVQGRTLVDFLNKCHELTRPGVNFYFHNLKFDGSFIAYYLLNELGYKATNKNTPGTKELYTLIDGVGAWYMIKFKYKKRVLTFKDSLKLFTGSSVEKIAEAFKYKDLYNLKKLEYNYARTDFETITKDDLKYIKNDTEIVARALGEFYAKGVNKLTIASSAFSIFKQNHCPHFYNLFPKLDKNIDNIIRKAYRGGYCYLNPKYTNKILKNVYVYDRNSMYPSECVSEYMPYGVPVLGYGAPPYNHNKLYIIHLKAYLFKDGLPLFFQKQGLSKNLYINYSGDEKTDIYITCQELKLIKKYYEIIDIEYLEYLEFNKIKGVLNTYMLQNYNGKETNTGAKKMVYKYLLNSLTGKFAVNPLRRSKKLIIKEDNDGITHLAYKENDIEEIEPIYTALSCFITSYARIRLIETIIRHGENSFVYADTDSIHTLEPINFLNCSRKLGDWDFEGIEIEAKYLKQKCYIRKIKDKDGSIKLDAKVAGLGQVPEETTFENFKIGAKFPKLKSRNVKGGVILYPELFEIKEDL